MELFSLSRIFMFWFLILLVLGLNNINSELVQDKQALLDFINKTPHGNRPKWNSSDSICNWVGVQCDSNQSYVYSLRLPGIGLLGQIPSNTLSRLTQLRILSLRSNRLSGPIPSDFSNLTSLTNLYLQNNVFSGDFPSSLTQLTRLFRLDLSSNNFTGEIPIAVNNLTHLTGIFLQNNQFNGNLPRIDIKGLISLDVSNNNLNGSIPETLGNFPASSFSGNENLCGKPLNSCNSSSSSPSPSPSPSTQETQIPKKSKSISKSVIIGISIGVGILIILLIVIPIIVKRCKKKPSNPQPRGLVGRSVGREGSSSSMRDEIAGTSEETGGGERHQLVFINGGNYKFDFEDLMRASAEVLGKGSKTTSYKAVLEDEGITIVVKRLKEVGITKNEFELQMELVGKVKHENVVPLRAFYYSSGEKLLIYDFMPNGSLSSLLHGSRGPHRPPLDWNTRKKIALSAGRGLAHLHASGNIVHGDIKSSNILLNEDLEASISDFGLNPLFGSSTPLNRGAGYRAPEVVETRKVTMKSDVYSFGVLLMELLTGKAPATLGDEGIELPRWVQSVVREEWTAEIFDLELTNGVEEEMVRLLEIAMACVSTVPDQRPSMVDVLRMIEDLNSPSIGDNDMVQP